MNKKRLLASFALAPFLAVAGCADKSTHKSDDNTVVTTSTTSISNQASPPSKPIALDEVVTLKKPTQPVRNKQVTVDAINQTAENELFPTTDISYKQAEKPATRVFQFNFNKHELSNEAKSVLMQHAEYLGKHSNLVLKVIGHTDTRGPKVYNEFLSKERAKSVAGMLIQYGANPGQIQVIGKGDAEPLNDVKSFAENRRVELDYLDLKTADASSTDTSLEAKNQ